MRTDIKLGNDGEVRLEARDLELVDVDRVAGGERRRALSHVGDKLVLNAHGDFAETEIRGKVVNADGLSGEITLKGRLRIEKSAPTYDPTLWTDGEVRVRSLEVHHDAARVGSLGLEGGKAELRLGGARVIGVGQVVNGPNGYLSVGSATAPDTVTLDGQHGAVKAAAVTLRHGPTNSEVTLSASQGALVSSGSLSGDSVVGRTSVHGDLMFAKAVTTQLLHVGVGGNKVTTVAARDDGVEVRGGLEVRGGVDVDGDLAVKGEMTLGGGGSIAPVAPLAHAPLRVPTPTLRPVGLSPARSPSRSPAPPTGTTGRLSLRQALGRETIRLDGGTGVVRAADVSLGTIESLLAHIQALEARIEELERKVGA